MKVYFERVGHSNANFSRECNGELTYEWLYEQIKPYCAPRKISFHYNEKTGYGLIFAGYKSNGYQTIGGFKIEK